MGTIAPAGVGSLARATDASGAMTKRQRAMREMPGFMPPIVDRGPLVRQSREVLRRAVQKTTGSAGCVSLSRPPDPIASVSVKLLYLEMLK